MTGLLQPPRAMKRLMAAGDERELRELWRKALRPDDKRFDDLYRLLWGTVHGLAGLVVERVFQLVQTDDERITADDDALDVLVEALRAPPGERVSAPAPGSRAQRRAPPRDALDACAGPDGRAAVPFNQRWSRCRGG